MEKFTVSGIANAMPVDSMFLKELKLTICFIGTINSVINDLAMYTSPQFAPQRIEKV